MSNWKVGSSSFTFVAIGSATTSSSVAAEFGGATDVVESEVFLSAVGCDGTAFAREGSVFGRGGGKGGISGD